MAFGRENDRDEKVTRREETIRETRTSDTAGERVNIPVVEEELAIGKRTVETGGVRVEKNVTAQPVSEDINLREERVTIDRRPVDRPVDPSEMHAFENATVEMRERAEEAVVEKKARVVEEVVVGKETRERTEHIEDQIRRSDVKVVPVVPDRTAVSYESMDSSFRTHYKQNFANSEWDYDNGYSHAYRYGYDVAGENKPWPIMESDLRTKWESKNKGTWERFKDAIRYGFEQRR